MKTPFLLLLAIGLVSCAKPPSALIIAEEPKEKTTPAVVPSEFVIPAPAKDDGLRMPDMLALPNQEQLRSASPDEDGDGDGEATVIIRPPKE